MNLVRNRGTLIAILLGVEVVALAAMYQVLNLVECNATDAYGACRFLRSLAARALVLFAVAVVFAWARPEPVRAFRAASDAGGQGRLWFALHLAGVVLLVLPAVLFGAGGLAAAFGIAGPILAAGSVLAAVGGAFWLAPPPAWAGLLRAEPVVLPAAVTAGFLLPDLAGLALPIWDVDRLTAATFAAVESVLWLLGAAPEADAATFVLGVDDFVVQIARPCSGVEGFALVAGFVAIYAGLFRREIRPLRFVLVVLPLGLLLSWLFNVTRISGLILIGARVSPDLAVNGFHSYAGWLFFLALALLILVVAHRIAWFQRVPVGPAVAGPPLRADPVAAAILPFVSFMAASIAVGAFFPEPELGYPVKAAVMAIAVAYWWPAFRALDWRPDAVAIGAGIVVGALWLASAERGGAGTEVADALSVLGGLALAAWIATRIIGTVVLVPIIEEAFFRGYLMTRMAEAGGLGARVVAIAVSSVAFGILHGRWVAAGLAGVVFALVLLRKGRLSDAIVSHAVANGIVAAGAVWEGDWSLV